MSHAYLSTQTFKLAGLIAPQVVDQLELSQPGWVDRQLELNSAWVDARLSKRYAVPFADPAPDIVVSWVARLTTVACYLRRGVDPSDKQWQQIEASAEAAKQEIKEAADSVTGLYELPLRSDTTQTGITKGGPRHKSTHSPFAWSREQAAKARCQ